MCLPGFNASITPKGGKVVRGETHDRCPAFVSHSRIRVWASDTNGRRQMTGHAQSGIRWAASSSYQLVRTATHGGKVIECSRDKLPKSGSGNGGWDVR